MHIHNTFVIIAELIMKVLISAVPKVHALTIILLDDCTSHLQATLMSAHIAAVTNLKETHGRISLIV